MSTAVDSAPEAVWNTVKRWAPILWISIASAAAWVLWDRLRAINAEEVLAQLRELPLGALLGGIACCFASYMLVGIYEGIAVRVATGRYSVVQPFVTAWIANPIGHVVGVAVVSGGALRYRRYSAVGLSSLQIGAVIVLAAMPYILGVGWLVDIALLLSVEEASKALHLSTGVVIALGIIGLAKDFGWLAIVSMRREPLRIGKVPIRLPGPKITLLQIAFGATEVFLNGTILYLFMPTELSMDLLAFIAIYLIALIAGQISHVPAGLGVLEAALLLMLPHIPPAKLLGAVLAYRAVFQLLPFAVGLLLLVTFEATDRAGIVRQWLRHR